MSSRAVSLGSASLALFASLPAMAQAPPPAAQRGFVYSSYEQETIDEVLARLHEVVDPDPENKLVERVEVVPLDVSERRDVLPLWTNYFHVTSRRSVIERELLVRQGSAYQQVLVDETIRNLRRLPQLSAVLVVATKGSAPDRVAVVVITKDVWSLRLNWDVQLTAGGVELFEAQPAEWNFLGTHQTLSGLFMYEPAAYTFGLGYVAPRLGTSRVAVEAAANGVVNRASNAPEGSFGSLVVGQPLYSALVDWAWDATVAWHDNIVRFYQDAQHVQPYPDPATHLSAPEEWRLRQYLANYEATRSFGWEVKHDFTFAAGIDRLEYRTVPAGVDARTEADFVRALLPVSDTRVGPSIQYHTYTKRYLRVFDFDTLALQEDYRLGHDVVLRVYPSFRALGSTRDVLGLYGAVSYSIAVRDGLMLLAFQSTTEPESERIADASISPTAHFVSPSVGSLGRLVLDATMLYRWRNSLNQQTFLGGSDRLRGYPTNLLHGQNFISYNVEFRSRPVEILSCQLAGVGFLDAGDAFEGSHDFKVYQSLGFGIRALFPWLDRVVFRADLGFPIERPFLPAANGMPPQRIPPYALLVSFDQAFLTPSVSPEPVLPTGQ